MSRLVLIDGNAIIHRGFHALPPFTAPDGRLVNAVYGFFSMFLKIIQDVEPCYLTVCFDRPKPTFRKALYVGYQAHRPKMDEGLSSQIVLVHEILEKAGIPIFEIDGYEADDIIGTLAFQAISLKDQKEGEMENGKCPLRREARKMEIVIVSGDRDMLQLVNSHVKVLAPITGITKMILFDEEEVERKFEIKPRQMIDYKALRGDASDGYPGVAGVGPKTAGDLLKRYTTLENIYKSLEEIKKKNENLALKLAQGAEAAGMAKKLATIVTDAPISLEFKKCEVGKFDKEKMKEEFEKFGFRSLVKRIANETKETEETQKKEDKKNGEQLGLL